MAFAMQRDLCGAANCRVTLVGTGNATTGLSRVYLKKERKQIQNIRGKQLEENFKVRSGI